jgi:hypothetical protein
MMKRFSRRRRSGGDKSKGANGATEWLPKLVEAGIVDTTSLEAWTECGIPSTIATIGRGTRGDGTDVIVAFSARSGSEALLAGLSATAMASEKKPFTGALLLVAPQWTTGARRLLALLGRSSYAVEAMSAPGLGTVRSLIQAEPLPGLLAASAAQLAARLPTTESRAAFRRAALAFEGLAAKHGGAVRVGLDRIELVVLARRVAELRIVEDSAVLEIQIGGRSSTPLAAAGLANALDGLEGQIRRRLNDRKVREGEEGLRGRVVAKLADEAELRGFHGWPTPGCDLDVIDGVGLNAEGDPVLVAVREEMEWTTLAAVLEELGPLTVRLPVLFAEESSPIRLSTPRLLLAAERFSDGLERALAALTLAYELRQVSAAADAAVDLVSNGSGSGAQERTARRGRRGSGRGRSSGRRETKAPEASEPAAEEATTEEAPAEKAATEGEDSGRSRRRGRRRPRRSRGEGGEGADVTEKAEAEPVAAEGREGEGRRRTDRAPTKSPRFEEISMMDLDDGSNSAAPSRRSREDEPDDDGSGGSSRPRRSSRRGRRGGRSDSRRESEASTDAGEAETSSKFEEAVATPVAEEDLVDADDLSEILARLADETSDFDGADSADENYEDSEEIDEDAAQSARRKDRDSRRRSRKDDVEEDNRSSHGRAAILVHGDRDSVLSAVLLARDIRQLEGLWVYPQEELMTFFRSIATDLREDTRIYVIGFSPSPARDVIQAAALYRGRLTWFGRQGWPPEDLVALQESLGAKAVLGGDGIDSTLPLVLETCTRRSRFSDKLVDLATGRFTQHDFERWGRLWRARIGEIALKSGDIRGDIADLLAGRPSDLAQQAALVEVPPAPLEVAWVAENDFRLVHFGGQTMVIVDVDQDLDLPLCARIARERYSVTLSLAHRVGEETFVLAGEEVTGKRALDYLAVTEHLVNKLEWAESRSDGDHVARFGVRELGRYPERQEEIIGEIAMGRSLLER